MPEGERAVVLRSLQVVLPNQEHNTIKTSWPGIGCWFWAAEEFKPDGYKRFIDLREKHSSFKLLTTTIRCAADVSDTTVHDQIKAAAGYARKHDMGIVMDLESPFARTEFARKYPDELQGVVRLKEVKICQIRE